MPIAVERRVGEKSVDCRTRSEEQHTEDQPPPEEKGIQIVPERLRNVVHNYAQLLVNRWDVYAWQRQDGSYRCIHSPLSYQLLWRHLKGQITLGVYSLDEDNRARWLAFDADDDDEWRALLNLSSTLRESGIGSYLERSRRGGHLWLFFEEPLSGKAVTALGKALLARQGSDMEMFPKRGANRGGPGSLVRLPLGIHRRDGKRYPLVNQDGTLLGQTVQEQLRTLQDAEKVSSLFVAEVLGETLSGATKRVSSSETQPESSVTGQIDRLKQVDLLGFVGVYVELTPAGKGHCPFHDDDHMSFSVNSEGNYWNCFAGCGGGDIIHFWERWRGISRREAIAELAKESRLPDGWSAVTCSQSRPTP